MDENICNNPFIYNQRWYVYIVIRPAIYRWTESMKYSKYLELNYKLRLKILEMEFIFNILIYQSSMLITPKAGHW